MKLKPVRNMVCVSVEKQDETTKGGIIIPGNFNMHPYVKGRVLAVGPGRPTEHGTYIAPAVKVGDLVLFGAQSGVKLSYEGEDYLMIDADETFAIVNETADVKLQ